MKTTTAAFSVNINTHRWRVPERTWTAAAAAAVDKNDKIVLPTIA